MLPTPSSTPLVGCRIPLLVRDGELHGRGAATWLSGGTPIDLPLFDPTAISKISTRGTIVRVDGRPFAQGVDGKHAAELSAWLRAFADPDADRKQCVELALSEGLRWDRLRDQLHRVQHETRWLRAASDVYAVALFALSPLLVVWFGPEAGLLRALLPLGALHLLTLFSFALAQRRLDPTRTGDLVEALIAMALYPPLLLRGHADLTTGALSGYHPAAVAAVLLEGPALQAFLRRELVRARAASHESAGSEVAALEAAAIETLVESLGDSAEALLAPPAPIDPLVKSYCPACHEGYRCSSGVCTDCYVALLPLSAPPALLDHRDGR